MSEEEKLLNDLKDYLNYLKGKKIMTSFRFNIVDLLENSISLIEKQQKEIEEKTTIIMAGAEKVKQLEKEYISKNKIREWLDRFDIEEDLQNKYDELLGSEAIYKFLKELLEEK